MPILKKSKHERFAQLVARGESATRAYVAVGYSEIGARGHACRLVAKGIVATRITELQAEIAKSLVAESIAIKEARVRAVNDRWLKMQQVITERAADASMQQVAGGKTGLLAHDQKGVGAGPAATVIDVYEVDTGLLKELREHEVQAAKELGQWVERGELEMPGPVVLALRGVDETTPWVRPNGPKTD